MSQYLEANNILDGEQVGFRKGHSTTETTASLLNDIYSNMSNQMLTNSIFVDFSKAFDSINHELTLLKLRKIGISELSVNWFNNYLTNRQQTTVIRNKSSTLWTPFPNIKTTKKSLIYRGSELWNNLPMDVRNIETFEAFKTYLKTDLRYKLV